MYKTNYLANTLRSSSLGYEKNCFATLLDGTEVSYESLFSNAEKIAAVLQLNGVKAGDRVAAQVGKSITTVELYLGTILAGGVFLPLNTDYMASEVEYFLVDAQPAVFICDPDSESTLQAIAQKAGVLALLTLSQNGLEGSLCDQLVKTNTPYVEISRDVSDIAAILYTSGTTGRSKGAMLSHGALASNALTLADYWQFSREDSLIHALPIFHIHGLFVAINITLCAGSHLHFLPRFDAAEIMSKMASATVLMGVPTFYVRLLQQPDLNQESTSSMRLFVSGSAPLLTETHQRWQQKTGQAILERYGMTETNMNTSNPYNGDRRPGTVGFPLPGVEVKVCDPISGEELADGEIGQLEVKGPNVFSGYWNMPEKTAEELRSTGWFLTGDLGVRDSDGYISIVGRSKDLIISGGYNVYPKEIEAVIDDIEEVKESAVIGLPHFDFGEAVVAVIVSDLSQHNALQEKVVKHTEGLLAKFKRPKKIYFVSELPRNTMGKVQKAQLRDHYKDTFNI